MVPTTILFLKQNKILLSHLITTENCILSALKCHSECPNRVSEEPTISYRSFAQQCHNWKFVIFQEKLLKVLKCCNFLWVQRRHNCTPVASFANCVMTLYLLKVHLQTFLFLPITQKCTNFKSWHSCRKWAISWRWNQQIHMNI